MTRKRTRPAPDDHDDHTVLDAAASLAPLRLERPDERSIIVSVRLSVEGEALKRQLDILLALLLQRLEQSLAALVAEIVARAASPRAPALPPPVPQPRLTRRELEVVALLARRYTHTEIMDALSIERSTLLTHLRNIRRKLGNRGKVLEWWERNRARYPQLDSR